MKRPGILAPIGAGIFIFLLMSLFPLPLPSSLRDRVSQQLSDVLHRKVQLGDARIDFSSLAISLHQITLTETDQLPILLMERLDVEVSLLASIMHGNITLDRMIIDKPMVFISNADSDESGLHKLIRDIRGDQTDEKADHVELTIHRLFMHQGSLHLLKGRQQQNPLFVLSDIEFDMEDFSSTLQEKSIYRLFTGFHGQKGKLVWQGQLGLKPFSSIGSLRLQNLELSPLLPLLRPWTNIAFLEGELNASGNYHYSETMENDQPAWGIDDASIKLAHTRFGPDPGKTAVASLDKLDLEGISIDSEQHKAVVKQAVLENSHIEITRTEDGLWNWREMFPGSQSTPTRDATAPEESTPNSGIGWQFGTENLSASNLSLSYHNAMENSTLSVGSANLAGSVDGSFGTRPSDMRIRLDHAQMETIQLASADEAIQPWMEVHAIELGLSTLGMKDRSIIIEKLMMADGEINVQRIPSLTQNAQTSSASDDPWTIRLQETNLKDMKAYYPLEAGKEAIPIRLEGIEGNATQLSWPLEDSADLVLTGKILQGGDFKFNGQFDHAQQNLSARLTIEGMNLSMLQSFVPEQNAFIISNGSATLALEAKYPWHKGDSNTLVSGQASLENIILLEQASGSILFGSKALDIHELGWSPEKKRLLIREVRISEPQGLFAVDKDGQSNISKRVLQPERLALPEQKTSGFQLGIGRIIVEKGMLDYSDQSLLLPYATRITDLNGTIGGINSQSTAPTTLNLGGRILPYGEASIKGSFVPSAMDHAMDLDIHLANVDMPSLTPFAATFAGRKIDAGKLDMDILYRITQGHLHSDSHLLMRNFRLGSHVQNHDVSSLSLDLALSLLRSPDGKISLSIPVEGQVNDPHFSYSSVFRTALFNMLSQIITTPFNLLDTLMAGDHDLENGEIFFAPGKSDLAPPEKEKLASLFEHLTQKPDLLIKVHGGFDTDHDTSALQKRMVALQVMASMAIQPLAGQDPDPVDIHDASQQHALESLANNMGILNAAIADYKLAKGRSPDRVGVVASWFASASQTPDFYETLMNNIANHTMVKNSDLEDLARRRALAIKGEMTRNRIGALSRRVNIMENRPARYDSHKGITLSLELDLAS